MINLTRYPYTQDKNGWAMDDTHIDALYRLLLHVKPKVVVEVGCWYGRSTCAYVEAQRMGISPTVHLVDISFTDSLRKVVANAPDHTRFILHECSSNDFRIAADIVVIDADHNSLPAARDFGWAVGWRTLWIVAHDVCAYPKMTDHQGAWEQGQELVINPHYKVSIDEGRPDDGKTWRGLLIAGPEEFEI